MADSITTDLDELLKSSRRVRRSLEPQWMLNLAYYLGEQWVSFDGFKLYEPELEDWRAKLVDNRIQPVIRTEIAKMTKTRPVWVGVPRSADDEDLNAARLAERVLEWEWKNLDMLRKLRAALLWSRVTGSGFWKVCWDPELGDSTDVLIRQDGSLVKDSYDRPMKSDQLETLPADYVEQNGVTSRKVAMGDIRLELRTPFEMFPDPLAGEDGIESAEWIGEEAVYSREHVYARFPLARELNIEPDSNAGGGIVESRMPGRVLGINDADTRKHGILLREYWCKPNSEHPNGKHVVWTKGGEILHDGDNPYPWLPYVMFRGIPMPGRFWPTCTTEQLISPQTELNKVESQIAENAERFGNPSRARPSTYEGDEWLGLPGEEVEYVPTGGPDSLPQFIQPPELPAYVQNRISQIEGSIREIAAQHEVSNGTVPAGVTAASAINLLQEQDDTRLGPDIADMEEAIAGAGRRIIYLVANHWNDQRMIRVGGDDGPWQFQAWRRGLLKGDQGVEVQAGSGMPQSKAAKQAAIGEVLRMLAQMPNMQLSERDLHQVFQEYEVGGLEKFFATIGEDDRQVAREHQHMLAGAQLPINDWDDDDAHIALHVRFMKSSTYEELDDRARISFVEHLAAHRQRVAEKAAQALQPPQVAMPGGPGSPPASPLAPPQGAAAAPPQAGVLPPMAA
jgi:hypothetical protein